MVWNREEYIAHMRCEDVGKEMFCELFGPLIGLEDEWAAQGASAAECDLSAFGWDSVLKAGCGGEFGAITGIAPILLEDNERFQVIRDDFGRKTKMFKGRSTLPLPLEYPVTCMDDWLQVKHWYEFREDRVDMDEVRACKKAQEQGALVICGVLGAFSEPRNLMGDEELCVAYYDEPELIQDMLNTFADTAEKVLERVQSVLTIDNLFIHEDMAGKSGPLAGPSQFREFMLPYYRRLWDNVSAHGAKLFSQDSDGNMNALIDVMLEAGINNMHPFEPGRMGEQQSGGCSATSPGSGMDMVKSREKYGNRLAIKGGIDKYALLGTKEDIRRELEYKMTGATRGGGTVFALDHRIPNGVPLENYRYYVKLGRELLGLPAAQNEPHVRMAF